MENTHNYTLPTNNEVDDAASELCKYPNELSGQSWENVRDDLAKGVHGDLNSILTLINLAFDAGFRSRRD